MYVNPLTGIPHRREDLRRTPCLEGFGVEAHESIVGVDWKSRSSHNSARQWGGGGRDVKSQISAGYGESQGWCGWAAYYVQAHRDKYFLGVRRKAKVQLLS